MDVSIQATDFGLLIRRDAREAWSHEALQFTPWLLEHIGQLNEAIGFEIELLRREERVGPFAVDLYGKEVQTGHPAIIENQLEPTDHGHLGQLLTYAAGLKAGVIVWIAPKFRDEHRAALNWLNEISPQEVSFFGIEIEILEINGQRAANCKAVAQPNDWVGARSVPGVASERMRAYQTFYGKALEALKSRAPGITAANKAQPISGLVAYGFPPFSIMAFHHPRALLEYLLLLVTLFRAVVRDRTDLMAENLLLRQQLVARTRPTRKRPRLRSRDKLLSHPASSTRLPTSARFSPGPPCWRLSGRSSMGKSRVGG